MILLSDLLEIVPEYVPGTGGVADCHPVNVPLHIWHALNLQQGMPYHVDLYTNRRGVLENEIICSSLTTRLWPHLWRFKVAFHDESGLLSDLAEIFEEMNIDIVSCRAETAEPEGLVNFELMLNVEDYINANPQHMQRTGSRGESLPILRGQILRKFIKKIAFYGDEPLLSLRRIPQLVMAHRRIPRPGATDPESVILGESYIPVPIRYLKRIRDVMAADFPEIARLDGDTARAVLRADTEASVVRLMILFPRTRHLALDIKHNDRPGALAAISKHIKKRELNLLQLRTDRIAIPGGVAITRIILSVPKKSEMFANEDYAERIQRDLERSVAVVHQCDVRWPGS